MFHHDVNKEQAYRFSNQDKDHLLSSRSAHPIELDDAVWTTAEHYLWAHLVADAKISSAIAAASSAEAAFKLGSPWYRRKIKDWKKLRRVYMTRALYTKVQMYPEVKAALLATLDQDILETSLYDHYWGIGRDQRGENTMGKIWMDIRTKLATVSS